MNTSTKAVALMFAGTLSLSTLYGIANAKQAATTANKTYVFDSITVPDQARTVLSNVRNARIALFDGKTDAAADLVKKAQSGLDKSVSEFAIKIDSKGYGVPVDSSISFAEGFEPDDAKKKIIEAAGELAKQGKPKDAYKKMLNSGVALDFKYAVLPMKSTLASLEKAQKQLQSDDFYAANLALKAIETSIVVEQFGAAETPKQGYEWQVISK